MIPQRLSNELGRRSRGVPPVEQVFAIIRVDEFLGPDAPAEQCIAVKKIVRDADEAEREVERLNELQKGKGCRYFVQATRLELCARPDDDISPQATGRGSDLVSEP